MKKDHPKTEARGDGGANGWDFFISYSHCDKTIAEEIQQGLEQKSYRCFRDEQDIPASTDIRDEIVEGIRDSDSFLFLMSQDSISSFHCAAELAQALRESKRILPVVVRKVESAMIDPALRRLKWIEYAESGAADAIEVAHLLDVEWMRMHTRLLQRAREWRKSGQPDSLRLRGRVLQEAEAWFAQADISRVPASLHGEYIHSSRLGQNRAAKGRWILAAAVGLALSITAGIAIWKADAERRAKIVAKKEAQTARRATSIQLAVHAENALESKPQQALLLGVEALRAFEDESDPRVLAAVQAMLKVVNSTGGTPLYRPESLYEDYYLSEDGRMLFGFDSASNLYRLPLVGPKAGVRGLMSPPERPSGDDQLGAQWIYQITEDKNWLLSGSEGDSVRLWKLDGGTARVVSLLSKPSGVFPHDYTEDLWPGISEEHGWVIAGLEADRDSMGLWKLSEQAQEPLVISGIEKVLQIGDYMGHGRWIATADEEHSIKLWDLSLEDPTQDPVVLKGHQDVPLGVTLGPGGTHLVTASEDGQALLWKFDHRPPDQPPVVLPNLFAPLKELVSIPQGDHDEAEELSLREFLDEMTSTPAARFLFSPDGRWLLGMGSVDLDQFSANIGNALLWDLQKKPLQPRPILHGSTELFQDMKAFMREINGFGIEDAKFLEVHGSAGLITLGVSRTVRLWDLRDPSVSIPFPSAGSGVTTMDVIDNGPWVITGYDDGTIRMWNLDEFDLEDEPIVSPIVLRGHEAPISWIVPCPDARHMVSVSEDGEVRVWDLAVPGGSLANVSSLHDRLVIASNPVGNEQLWMLESGHYENIEGLPPKGLSLIKANGKGDDLVAVRGDDHSGWDLWEVLGSSPSIVETVSLGAGQTPLRTARNSERQWLVSANLGFFIPYTSLHLTDLDHTNRPQIQLREGDLDSIRLEISSDARWLFSLYVDRYSGGETENAVVAWDLTKEDPGEDPITLEGHETPITEVRLSPEGCWLATASSDGTLLLWDLRGDRPKATARLANPKPLTSMQFIREDALATADGSGVVCLWTFAGKWTRKGEVRCGSRVECLAGNEEGTVLVAGAQDKATMWRLAEGLSDRLDFPHPSRSVTAVDVDESHGWLVTGDDGGTLRLWDLKADSPGSESARFQAYDQRDAVRSLELLADGSWLVSKSRYGDSRLIPLGFEALRTIAAKTAGRQFTPDQWSVFFRSDPYRPTFGEKLSAGFPPPPLSSQEDGFHSPGPRPLAPPPPILQKAD